jgi:DNA-binding NtrC family response regulator
LADATLNHRFSLREFNETHNRRVHQLADKILVVKDDNVTRTSICGLLRTEGYDVIEASNGAQAAELFKTERIDLVITDFYMPHLDGVGLVEQIHAASPQTPVVFMTGYLSRGSAEAILKGKAEYMSKPISVEILQSTLQRLLRSKLLSSLMACLSALQPSLAFPA